ncbi:MAG: STN domain-containing protein [Sphingobacterium sp.]
MYKNIVALSPHWGRLHKCFLIMKLLSLFLLVFLVHASATTRAQKISLSVSNAELSHVLTMIQRQTNLDFLYSNSQLENVGKIDLHVKNANLSDVLETCLSPRDLIFFIEKD